MIYMLEFLGLLAVAICLAASPLLVNIIDRFFPQLDDEGQSLAGHGPRSPVSIEKAEMRDEIRRVTDMLETTRLNIGPHHRDLPTAR